MNIVADWKFVAPSGATTIIRVKCVTWSRDALRHQSICSDVVVVVVGLRLLAAILRCRSVQRATI